MQSKCHPKQASSSSCSLDHGSVVGVRGDYFSFIAFIDVSFIAVEDFVDVDFSYIAFIDFADFVDVDFSFIALEDFVDVNFSFTAFMDFIPFIVF